MTQQPFFTNLKGRACIKISGIERQTFLQGLITNDLELLKQQDCVYACLLTPQGKFLFDFFITQDQDTLCLDCESGQRASDLLKLLTMYKLRAQAGLTLEDNITVYAIIGAEIGHKDPRHPTMGYRSFTPPKDIAEQPFEDWDSIRISLTIPDGSRDLIIGKSTMDEARMDKIHGISYEKGCYVGQELTARMHYRGLGKKHLYTVTAQQLELEAFPAPQTALVHNDITIGDMRSSCGDLGIALLKDQSADHIL
tara:strand:+ start:1968 stop:2726 length:759 start_codon:yes stop_codon:yes gene_type:complete